MHQIKAEYRDAQAWRFMRPDWRRFVRPNSELARFYERIERKYRPDQPRVPAGVREGGQWTDDHSASAKPNSGGNDSRILSDADPDNDWVSGAQYAANRPRYNVPVFINGHRVELTPSQAARVTVVEAQAREAIARVQELEPNWRPKPSLYETVDGLIAARQAEISEAAARIIERQSFGIGPGPFATEWIPARGPNRNLRVDERTELNKIGRCHTCGTDSPGTTSGNYVADHQPPTALNNLNRPQRLYPQCLTCSRRQGGWITSQGAHK